jgi:hypothetical protein
VHLSLQALFDDSLELDEDRVLTGLTCYKLAELTFLKLVRISEELTMLNVELVACKECNHHIV